jgi:hypothetical protein
MKGRKDFYLLVANELGAAGMLSAGLVGMVQPLSLMSRLTTDFGRRLPASPAPPLERAWDARQAERYQRGEISQRPGYAGNPFRPR